MEKLNTKVRKKTLLVGVTLIVFGILTSTLAANLTLNFGKKLEFSQGYYKIDACQSYISIALATEYYSPSALASYWPDPAPTQGDIYLNKIEIKSLDTRTCANTTFGIKFFSVNSAIALDLYLGGDGNPINELTLNIGNSNDLTIPSQSADDNLSLDQPTRDSSGIWTINIKKPLALNSAVELLTVESGPLASPSPSTSP